MYSSQLLDHFQNPRCAGELDPADASAEVSNPACGDVVRLTLKLSGGTITQSRFKAQGCVPTIACASVLAEFVQGKTITQARALDASDIASTLGNVPQASMHAVTLALEALALALNGCEGKA